MSKYCSAYKFYVCDILNQRCIQEPEDVGYSCRGPNCKSCEIANIPEPKDTRIAKARSIIKLR